MKLSEIIRAAILIGRRDGFVTFDQLNELLSTATSEPDDIETLLLALSEEKINVVDND
jgi:Sigma-70 factor, region 1.1